MAECYPYKDNAEVRTEIHNLLWKHKDKAGDVFALRDVFKRPLSQIHVEIYRLFLTGNLPPEYSYFIKANPIEEASAFCRSQLVSELLYAGYGVKPQEIKPAPVPPEVPDTQVEQPVTTTPKVEQHLTPEVSLSTAPETNKPKVIRKHGNLHLKEDIVDFVDYVRNNKRMTIAQLAKVFGVSSTTISRVLYLLRKRDCAPDVLLKVSWRHATDGYISREVLDGFYSDRLISPSDFQRTQPNSKIDTTPIAKNGRHTLLVSGSREGMASFVKHVRAHPPTYVPQMAKQLNTKPSDLYRALNLLKYFNCALDVVKHVRWNASESMRVSKEIPAIASRLDYKLTPLDFSDLTCCAADNCLPVKSSTFKQVTMAPAVDTSGLKLGCVTEVKASTTTVDLKGAIVKAAMAGDMESVRQFAEMQSKIIASGDRLSKYL